MSRGKNKIITNKKLGAIVEFEVLQDELGNTLIKTLEGTTNLGNEVVYSSSEIETDSSDSESVNSYSSSEWDSSDGELPNALEPKTQTFIGKDAAKQDMAATSNTTPALIEDSNHKSPLLEDSDSTTELEQDDSGSETESETEIDENHNKYSLISRNFFELTSNEIPSNNIPVLGEDSETDSIIA